MRFRQKKDQPTGVIIKPRIRIHVGCASVTPKSLNRDSVRTFRREDSAGIVVCDGVGLLSGSAQASQTVADNVVSGAAAGGPKSLLVIADDLNRDLPVFGESGEGATTMIAAAGSDDGSLTYSYLGNGSLFELRAYPSPRFDKPVIRIAELTLPNVSYESAPHALNSWLPMPGEKLAFSAGTLAPRSPSLTAFLAVTDGIATDDDRELADDSSGGLWREVPLPLKLLIEDLERCWFDLVGEFDRCDGAGSCDSALTEILNDSLARIRDTEVDGRSVLSDDASAGLVVLDGRR